MSRIENIRAGLKTVLDGVTGIQQVVAYPPEKVTANGTAWIGFFDTGILAGPREVHVHSVPVTVIVNRNGRLPAGLEATEPVIDAALAAIRANQSLGAVGTDRVQVTRIQQGVWGDPPDLVGFQLTLQVKESFGATYGG